MKAKKPKICTRRGCNEKIPGVGKYCSKICSNFEKLKTVTKLKKAIWRMFSEKIKERDTKNGYFTCFSCRKYLPVDKYNAGHYKHGDNVGTWIHPKNVHAQCATCNLYMNGNRDNYALWLEKTYGFGILQELDKAYHSNPQTWTMDMLRAKYIELYNELLEN